MMTGRELAQDLAQYLRSAGYLAFTEIAIRETGGRLDVMAVKPHVFARKDIRGYEVKTSRADFHRDAGSNKWVRYLQVCHRVYFACPSGLISPKEVPVDAGLIVRGENGWTVTKVARGHTPTNLTADAVFAMLYREHEEYRQMRRLKDRIVAEENIPLKEKAKTIGWQIANRLATRNSAEVEQWAGRIKTMLEQIAGKRLDTWSDRAEIETIIQTALHLQRHQRLLRDIGSLLQQVGYAGFEASASRVEKHLKGGAGK